MNMDRAHSVLSPSLLSADFLQLDREITATLDCGVDYLHFDVMDGHYVPNLTFGPPLLKMISENYRCVPDVHLMITNPEAVIDDYVNAGAKRIAFHPKTSHHPYRLCEKLKTANVEVGIAINPGETIDNFTDFFHVIDYVLVMSVTPGFSGQTFIPHCLEKIKTLQSKISSNIKIQVDGGVTLENAKNIMHAGADILVMGNAFFGQQLHLEKTKFRNFMNSLKGA